VSAASDERFDDGTSAVSEPRLAVVQSSDLRGDGPVRRLVDVALSSVAVLAVSPILLLIAVAVKLDSSGPALYSQTRVGRHGKEFSILKFRSMIVNAERIGPLVTGRRDRRITRLGAVLRATKLDELPQLINVLKGEMTLIGPRPEVPRYLPYYTDRELQLLIARPGLTGPGQLVFTDREAAELDTADDPESYYINHQLHPKLAVDIAYLSHRSCWHDVKIVLGTVALMFGRADVPQVRGAPRSP
jgi:lipopolysaccharide/colanic/teichoic acid biosynthesis glycosyltransferase